MRATSSSGHQTAPLVRPDLVAAIRRNPAGAVAVALVAIFLVLVLVDARTRGNINTGDTNNLVAGTRAALDCVGRGEFIGCGYLDESTHTDVFPYPLLQYLPAAVFVMIGLSDGHVVEALAVVSFVAFIGMLALAWYALRRRPRLGWFAVAGLLATTALYQATAAFGEMLAATAVLGAVVVAIHRRPFALFTLCLLAALSKETAAPFVVVLTLIAARDEQDGLLPRRPLTAAIVAGSISGMLLSAAFNVFRFGTVRNLLYLTPELHTPGVGRKVEFFLAGLVAPSNGILWFWPVVTLTVGFTAVTTLRRLVVDRASWRAWAPPAAVTLTFGAFLCSLAAWFTPFGWIAYGPRLAVPLLPATFVLCLHLVGDDLIQWFDRLGRAARIAVISGLVAISIPQYAAPWRWWPAVLQLLRPSDGCPPLTGLDVLRDSEEYYRSASKVMWRLRPTLINDLVVVGWSIAGLAWLLIVVACGCMITLAVGLVPDPNAPPENGSRSFQSER